MRPTGLRAKAPVRTLTWIVAVAAVLAGTPPVASAFQDGLTQEQLKKMYDDALVQLKASQDRKAELAGENEKLQARLAELEKQLADARVELAGQAERSFFLRSHYAAWQQFLQRYPSLLQRWNVFLEADLLSAPNDPPQWHDPEWPLSAEG
jgi:uncharacterized protein YukE